MADTNIDLTTGRFSPKQIAGQVFAGASGFGALRVAAVDQERAELTRAGRRFSIATLAAVTGIAPVQAIPSTAAQWAIWNTSLTDTMTFDELGVFLASGTAAAGITLWCALFTAPAQTSLATGITVASRSNSLKTSAAAIKSAVTITAPAAPQWFPVAKSDSANTGVSSVGCLNIDLKGGLMLPPLTGLAFGTLSGAGTSPLFSPVATWTEAAQDLE